jgi:hypothetical protein
VLRYLIWLPLFSIAIAPLSAQVRPGTKTPLPGKYDVNVGPASVNAGVWTDPCCQIFVAFPAVLGAELYRVGRREGGGPEIVVHEAPVASFANPSIGFPCTALPNIRASGCVFGDTRANKGVMYTYRVWAIYPGAVASPPSPSANARLQ